MRRYKVSRLFLAALVAVAASVALLNTPAKAASPRTTKPGAPTGVVAIKARVFAQTGDVDVWWKPPVSDGGSPITRYKAEALPGMEACVSTGAEYCQLQGLSRTKTYVVEVEATNARGSGPYSQRSPVQSGPQISFTESMANNGYYAPPPFDITVQLSAPSSHPIRVDYVGSDAPADDLPNVVYAGWVGDAGGFSWGAGHITIPAGTTQATLPISGGGPVTGCNPAYGTSCYPAALITLADPTDAVLGSGFEALMLYVPPCLFSC